MAQKGHKNGNGRTIIITHQMFMFIRNGSQLDAHEMGENGNGNEKRKRKEMETKKKEEKRKKKCVKTRCSISNENGFYSGFVCIVCIVHCDSRPEN